MKIGILTFHHTTNYGATLQAYGLWKTIKSEGHDVEFIDYRPYIAAKQYWRPILPFKFEKNKVYVRHHALKELLKYLKMRLFLRSNMHLSKSYTRAGLKNFDRHYDVVICGSDQIWCLNGYRGFDPSYFLDFVDHQNTCRKISYAASFGKTEDLGKNKNLIRQLISQFDAISVRDSNSLRLIEQECNRQATRVLDPTFLIEYSEILAEPKFEKDYLLIYNEGSVKKGEENFIKSIADTNNLDIISIGKYNRIATKNLIGIGPEEWLGYFSKASYIVTNTYHGTIFSIIFKKPFTVLSSKGKTQKTNDLLKHLDLEKRIGLEGREMGYVPEEYLNINYNLVYDKLQEDVLRSKTYLFAALDGKQKRLPSISNKA
jgi:polysaccharide pyruvyl transferase WcaK-like protein